MRVSLAEAAIGGCKSLEAATLLNEGDIEGLLALNRLQFGAALMARGTGSEDEDAEDTDDGEDADDGEDDEDGDEDDDEKSDAESKRIEELKAESIKHRLRAKKLREERDALQRELEAARKGKVKATSKAKSEDTEGDREDGDDPKLAELEETKTKLERQNEDLLIRLEFMANTKYAWVNPKDALKLLDLDDVEIGEDGDVEGLDEAIDALAKAKPYLLKSKDGEDKGKRTGTPTGTKRKGNPDRDKLLSKYPALRR